MQHNLLRKATLKPSPQIFPCLLYLIFWMLTFWMLIFPMLLCHLKFETLKPWDFESCTWNFRCLSLPPLDLTFWMLLFPILLCHFTSNFCCLSLLSGPDISNVDISHVTLSRSFLISRFYTETNTTPWRKLRFEQNTCYSVNTHNIHPPCFIHLKDEFCLTSVWQANIGQKTGKLFFNISCY